MQMRGLHNRALVAPPAVLAAAGLGLVGQAWFAAYRPLPTYEDNDCTGWEGVPDGHLQRVVALGDSTLTGPGLEHGGQIWLRQALRSIAGQRRIEVHSLAAGGSRAHDVLVDQVPRLYRSDSPIHDRPVDVGVLSVGANDAIRRTPLRAFRRDVHGVLMAMRSGIRTVVVCGLPDLRVIPRAPHPLAVVLSRRGQYITQILFEECRATGAHLIPASVATDAFNRSVFTDDLFHPNATGHREMAKIAAPTLAEALVRSRAVV